jgi:hypothetical protein
LETWSPRLPIGVSRLERDKYVYIASLNGQDHVQPHMPDGSAGFFHFTFISTYLLLADIVFATVRLTDDDFHDFRSWSTV